MWGGGGGAPKGKHTLRGALGTLCWFLGLYALESFFSHLGGTPGTPEGRPLDRRRHPEGRRCAVNPHTHSVGVGGLTGGDPSRRPRGQTLTPPFEACAWVGLGWADSTCREGADTHAHTSPIRFTGFGLPIDPSSPGLALTWPWLHFASSLPARQGCLSGGSSIRTVDGPTTFHQQPSTWLG